MKSIFSIFKRGLEKTATKVTRTVTGLFTGIRAHDAASFYTLLLDHTKPYPLEKRRAALAALFQNEVWYPALLKGLAKTPGLYGSYLRLAARAKSPALACLPLRLRGAK